MNKLFNTTKKVKIKLILLFFLLLIFINFFSCKLNYSYEVRPTLYEITDILKVPKYVNKVNILIDEATYFYVTDNKKDYYLTAKDLNNTILTDTGFYYKNKYIGKEIFIDKNGNNSLLQLVSKLELDDYVASVLAAEMGPKFEREALKAQAVVSRTYVVEKILTNPSFKITNSTNYQVFNLSSYKDFLIYSNETKDLILSYNKEIIKAFFHSSSGGILTVPKYEWGGNDLPYYKIKLDEYSENTINWEYNIEVNKFIDLLIKYNLLNTKKDLFSITLTKRNEDRRVDQINLIFNDGTNLSIKGRTFREKFGTTIIKSLLFDTRIENNMVYFNGKGYGHGIGMSQWGANNMAKQQKNFIDILKFYYNNCKISKLIYSE